jgi:alkylation response protein AidB-like acyl-CoA dehydrogenase
LSSSPPELPPEIGSWREEVRAWLAAHHPPTPAFKLPQNPLEVATDEQFFYLRDWQKKLYEAGYVGVEWPAAYGGRGFPAGYQRVVTREMTRAGVPFLVNIVGLSWAGPIILLHGTETHKRDYIPKLLSAENIWCQGFSEPEAGSDLASLRTSARQDGEEYVINGHKVWTTQAVYADYCILLARSDPATTRHAGISYFLAPMKLPGIEVQPLIKMTGEGGFNQVIWNDVRIPRSALLGREGQGWELAVATLSFERGASEGSAGSGGGPDRSVSSLIRMARGLAQGGQAALADPVSRDRIAAFATLERANAYSVRRARIPGLVADRPMAIPLMMKLAGTEFDQHLSDFACELQGYAGALWIGDPDAIENAEWQRAYMNSYATTIAGGTSEILRNVLGEKVLGLPKSR